MTGNLCRLTGMLLLAAVAANANAASISLVPTSNVATVQTGNIVAFNVVMDFSTNTHGLGSDITLGGGFDIIFDSSALQFDGLTNAGLGDPTFGRNPDVLDGLLNSWGFADFNGLTGPALVGSVRFRVLSTMGTATDVSTAATMGIAGPFVSAVNFTTLLTVDYNSVEVTRATEVIFANSFEQ